MRFAQPAGHLCDHLCALSFAMIAEDLVGTRFEPEVNAGKTGVGELQDALPADPP